MTRQDIIEFLERGRKPDHKDPLHRWIGTREPYRQTVMRFFKWLYYPDIETKNRPKPAVVQNIQKSRREEKDEDLYRPEDVWTQEEDLLFCKHCPSKRDIAYHMVARDTGCRRDEMVKMKIKDMKIKPMEGGIKAEIRVIGKTGPGNVRVYRSYPYLTKWLSEGHPFPNVPSAPIFCGEGKKNRGRKIQPNTVTKNYGYYKQVYYRRLLDDPDVSEEDKRKMEVLLKKPWNPHFRRHTATTEISKRVKDPMLLKQLFRWSPKSNTHLRYLHYGSDDAIEELDRLDGLISADTANKNKDLLKQRLCASCNEPNTPDALFCGNKNCRIVLDWETWNQDNEEDERVKKEVEELKALRKQDLNRYNEERGTWQKIRRV